MNAVLFCKGENIHSISSASQEILLPELLNQPELLGCKVAGVGHILNLFPPSENHGRHHDKSLR